MTLSKLAKKELVKDLVKKISVSKEQIIVGYQGLTVSDLQELRKNLRKAGITFKIVKNTLLQRILDEAKVSGINAIALKKPTALVIGGDEVTPAKLIMDFAKKHKNLEILTGAIDYQAVESSQLKALASLPNREEMLGITVGTMAAPITSFLRVLSGNNRALVQVIKAIAESKSK